MNTSPTHALQRVEPILLSRNLDHTALFYEKLEFTVAARFDGYLILEREGVRLHFTRWPDLDPNANACACYLYVSGIHALYELWLHAGVIHPNGSLHRTNYDLWEFAVIDDDKNLLRVGERIRE
jgi:hypothetical protein